MIQEQYPIDLVQIESNELLYLTDYIKFIPIIYTEHDVSIMSFRGSLYQKKDRNFLSNFFDYLRKVYFHNKHYKDLDRVITLSKGDTDRLCPFFTNTTFSFIPTGVDTKYFAFREKTDSTKDLIFVGHYPHYPNEDAVLYFAGKILPLIRRQKPEVRFLIVGSHPTPKIIQLSLHEGVEFIGDVEDIRPYLKRAAVFVNSVRFSAGIKGKVLEPMAMGIPVVSTSRGLSGIEAEEGREVLIGDTPQEFAGEVISLLEDNDLYAKLASNARNLVEKRYDWKKIALRLDIVYKELVNDPMAKSNFKKFEVIDIEGSRRILEVTDKVRRLVEEAVWRLPIKPSAQQGPEELHIELTYDCNSKCIMCDLWDYRKRNPSAGTDLTLDEIKQCVQESELLKNVKTVVLSGGEPFLRKDIVDICGFFTRHLSGSSIGILTNAVETDTVVMNCKEILDKYRPKSLWLGSSLDGVGTEHDKIRGRNGTFVNFQKTLERVRKELPGLEFSVTMTLTPHNYNQLLPAMEFSDREKINFFAQFVVSKETRASFLWKADQLREVEIDVKKIIGRLLGDVGSEAFLNSLDKGDIDVNLLTNIFYWSNLVEYQRQPRRLFCRCISGSRFAMLDPYGNLYFCPLLKDRIIGSIRNDKFDDIWNSAKADEIRHFISKGNCSCWLVCIVFPAVSAVFVSSGKEDGLLEIKGEDGDGILDIGQKENLLANDAEYSSGKIILKSLPRGIGIGAHYGCNAGCIFCMEDEHQNFDLDIYNNFFYNRLKDVLPKAEYLNLCGFGELLLMPKVEEFLDILNFQLPKINKIITTNGIPVSQHLAKRMLRHKYVIQISLHASNPSLHRLLTRTQNFEQIIDQIRKIANSRGNDSEPHLVLISILNTLNIEDLPNLVRLAADLGIDEVVCNYITAFSNAHLKLSCFFKQEITNRKLTDAEEIAEKLNLSLRLPPRFGNNNSSNGQGGFCSEPWKYMYIETEGSVLPCCFAGSHIGYLDKENFKDIWNGPAYQNLRKSLLEHKPGSWCRYCYKYNPEVVNDIRSHITLRPNVAERILKDFSF